MNVFNYGTDHLTTGAAIQLLDKSHQGRLSAAATKAIRNSQGYVQEIVKNDKTVYGVNTGFGILANTKISRG